jgi:DNA-binding NarL/FixJ family response regulator
MATDRGVLRVVFAEDNYLVRRGTAALLAEVPEVELVRLAEEPQGLMAAVEELEPDAVLTDIRMPPTHSTEGIDAARRIRAEHPGTGVVVLSQYVEPQYARDLSLTASAVWATCSRRESATSTSWCARCRRCAGAGRPWTRRSSRR